MARKSALTKACFVEVATKYVDENGLNTLTMRVLGDLLGVDATACYRHFRSKGALLDAMIDAVFLAIVNAASDSGSPRERLEAQMMASRRELVAHPHLAVAIAVSEGNTPAALGLMKNIVTNLEAMGLSGKNLVQSYQAIETYTVGSCIFDLSRAPANMKIRRARYQLLENPAFDVAAKTVKSTSDVTEDAYRGGMKALVDYVETLAD